MRISPYVEADGTASPLSGMLTNKSAVARPPAPPPLALFSFLSFQRQRPRAENPDSQHARDDGIRLRSGAANSPHHLPLTHTHITVCCMRHAARGNSHRSSRDSTTTGPDWNMPPPRRLPVDHGVTLLSPFPQRQPGDHLDLQDDVISPPTSTFLPAGRASNTKEIEETKKPRQPENLSPEKNKTKSRSVSLRDLIGPPQLPRRHQPHPQTGKQPSIPATRKTVFALVARLSAHHVYS